MQNYSYSVFEFFYDKSFCDYNVNNYILKYRDLFNGKNYPERVEYKNELYIVAERPTELCLNIRNIIGVMRATNDNLGIYGSYNFLNTTMGNLVKELFELGNFKFGHVGTVQYGRDRDEIIRYNLTGLYLKNINDDKSIVRI